MDKIKVLFLCVNNSARSQMAEAFLKHYAGDKYEVYSAGIEPAEIHPLTRKVMAETGIDMSGQYSKVLKEFMGKIHFNYLIIVCSEAEEQCPKIFPGMGQKLRWSFEDPAGFSGTEEAKINKFREVRDLIRKTIKEWTDSYEPK